MFSIDEYVVLIKDNLEKQSDFVVEELKKILSYKFNAAIDLLDFSTFTEPTRFEMSIMMYSMDKNANEVFSEDASTPNGFAGSIEVLSNASYYHLQENQLDDFFEFYEQNDKELAIKEQQIITAWFVDCWHKAGGKAFKLPAYFGFHDDSSSFDLQNARFIDDEEKWG